MAGPVEEGAATFRERFADRLASRSEEITDAWLEGVARNPDLSLEALRDHIPEFLRDVAASLRPGGAVEASPPDEDYLRLHVEERLAQGYSVEQLLEEFGALPSTLYSVMEDLLASTSDVPAEEIHEVHRHVGREMQRIGRVAARLYRNIEMEQRRGLAEQLTGFGRALEHEVRGPLHTALVAIDLLEKPDIRDDPDSHDKYVGVLRERLERMAELLGEVRRFSAVEQSLAEEEWIPAREVVEDVYDELEEMAASQRVDLRMGAMDEDVFLNVPRLRLAIRNVVGNAIKYSDPEREDSFVEVSLRSPDDGPLQLAVEDNGIGVPEDARESIFEPGERAHPERGSGTGLGLAIVRQVLEQRRGAVSVEPTEEGSRFVLRLPAPLAVREI